MINFIDQGIVVDNGVNAYYPSLIYDASAFDTGTAYKFRCFYSTGTAIRLVSSIDGVTWTAPSSVSGLSATAHHPTVTYSKTGFGTLGAIKYKIWYWNSAVSNLLISTIRYAESVDGITWINDQAITQDTTRKLITGNSGDWNAGTWGFQKVFFNEAAENTGTNPFNYNYTAYYDANTGTTYQSTGLGYSIDGKHWFSSHVTPVLQRATAADAWDFYATSFASYIRNNSGFHCWYTGGRTLGGFTDNFGIGYAHSIDGVNWTKDVDNPIFSVLDGLTYRDERCYTPAVIDDGVDTLYMIYTAQGTAQTGRKKLGLGVLSYDASANVKAPAQGQLILVSSDRGFSRIMKLEAITLTETEVQGVLAGTKELKVKFMINTANSMKEQWCYLKVI